MSFNSDENDDEVLMKAIQASLEDMKQKTTPIDSDDESISDESISDESISDEINIISISSEDEIQPIPNETINQTNDDDITRAIQTSLVDYQTTEDNLLNDIIKKSLDTIEDDKKRKLEKEQQLQIEEDKLLSKIIEESYLSNVAIQQSHTSIISNSQNSQSNYIEDYEEDYEDEYMKMILQQIREQEEKESKIKTILKMRTIREEQDFEYEEALQKDIEKEREQKQQKNQGFINSTTLDSIINNDINTTIPSLKTEYEYETKSETNEEKPKTLEEIRKARLAFFEKK